MIEVYGNLWDHYIRPGVLVFITTNGTVARRGLAVMGRGCAREAKEQFPGIDLVLAEAIERNGNVPNFLGPLATFPVKHEWHMRADPVLIERSAAIIGSWRRPGHPTGDQYPTFVIPRPGCGNGHLSWDEVKPILAKYLDDQCLVISRIGE